MIKKNILIFLLGCLAVSCGKKGDPIYKDPKTKAPIKITYSNKA